MTRDLQLYIARALLDTGLLTRVYHSCQLVRDVKDQKLYPVYPQGRSFSNAGINDKQGRFAYIRTHGQYIAQRELVGSCDKGYTVVVPLRVVVFNDNEELDFDYLITRLLPFTFAPNITLRAITDDKWSLLRDESDIWRQHFSAKTFYVAFDVTVKVLLLHDTCEHPPCEPVQNPLCV